MPWRILVLLVLVGCGPKAPSTRPATDRMVVTRAQVQALNVPDAYEVVSRTRPEFLREKQLSGRTRVYAVVYMNGVRSGGPGILRNVRSGEVEEIRFVNGMDATTRYGTDHSGGVIEVTTRQGVRQ